VSAGTQVSSAPVAFAGSARFGSESTRARGAMVNLGSGKKLERGGKSSGGAAEGEKMWSTRIGGA
jgi:hypothetical protein